MTEQGLPHPLAIGHRGAPTLERENTLPSFRRAFELGADWIELDVKLTADAIPVVLHDLTLARLWHLNGPIHEVELNELYRLTRHDSFEIPTLKDALEIAQNCARVAVIDVATVRQADSACDIAGEFDPGTTAFTGDPVALARIRERRPDTTILFSWESENLPDRILLDRVRPQYLNQDHRFLTPPFIDATRELGMLVSTYTVDTAQDIDNVIERGVDAVISNDVKLLRQRLNQRGVTT